MGVVQGDVAPELPMRTAEQCLDVPGA